MKKEPAKKKKKGQSFTPVLLQDARECKPYTSNWCSSAAGCCSEIIRDNV